MSGRNFSRMAKVNVKGYKNARMNFQIECWVNFDFKEKF